MLRVLTVALLACLLALALAAPVEEKQETKLRFKKWYNWNDPAVVKKWYEWQDRETEPNTKKKRDDMGNFDIQDNRFDWRFNRL